MARWADLEREAPELAAGGSQLLHQHGLGLGYLATVRADGARSRARDDRSRVEHVTHNHRSRRASSRPG